MAKLTKTIGDKLEQKLLNIQTIVDEQNGKIKHLEQKVDDLNQRGKVNNVCFYGIPKESEVNPDVKLSSRIIRLINTNTELNMSEADIVPSHRIGNLGNNNKARPVIVKFAGHDKRVTLLKNAKCFKEKNIFIAEDLTKSRRELLQQRKLRLEGIMPGHLMDRYISSQMDVH